jgi:hypothetical protein
MWAANKLTELFWADPLLHGQGDVAELVAGF